MRITVINLIWVMPAEVGIMIKFTPIPRVQECFLLLGESI